MDGWARGRDSPDRIHSGALPPEFSERFFQALLIVGAESDCACAFRKQDHEIGGPAALVRVEGSGTGGNLRLGTRFQKFARLFQSEKETLADFGACSPRAPYLGSVAGTSADCRQIVKLEGIQERLYRIRVQVTINDGRWRDGVPFSDIPLRK